MNLLKIKFSVSALYCKDMNIINMLNVILLYFLIFGNC